MNPLIEDGGTVYKPGRIIQSPMPAGQDLISSVLTVCHRHKIQTATFTLLGSLASATVGVYDAKQQVYVTETIRAAMEIISCSGNVSRKDDVPHIHAAIMLADTQGNLHGGRTFSESRLVAGALTLQELIGPPLNRAYDPDTGLDLRRP